MSRTCTVRVPGDKSITHRALLIGALADGVSRVRAPLDAADTRSTRRALEQLGVRIEDAADGLLVHGRGVHGWHPPAAPIDCGNSGTTARLLMGALAGQPFAAELHGDASLESRPMTRVFEPLSAMGATFESMRHAGRLPVRMHGGALRSIDHVSPQSSAQVKSAILLAGLTGHADSGVSEPRLSRDHTERMLTAAGVPLERSRDHNGFHVRLHGRHVPTPLDLTVPGDFSSAAFFIALAVLSQDVEIVLPGVGVNPGRTGMLAVLGRMGAQIDLRNERSEAAEPVADVVAGPASLAPFTVEGAEVPSLIDEIPILAVLAARADGTSRITGAAELRVKETDRIRALVQNFRAVGVEAEELPDGLVVKGSEAPLRGRVETFGDHRIAMAFGVLGALPGNHIDVDDTAVVDVSFPGFWEQLERVRTGAAA